MKKKCEMSGKTGNILVVIYLFLSGIFTLNFLPSSIAANASGVAFLIAAIYGVVAIIKDSDYLFPNN